MTHWLDKTGEHLRSVDDTLLPPLAQEIVSLIGLSQALRLLKARGGIRTLIPYKATTTCQLASIVNITSVRALVEVYAGETLELPKSDQLIRQLRNQSIKHDREENNLSHAALALKYNLTRMGVKKILKGMSEAQPQNMELFE